MKSKRPPAGSAVVTVRLPQDLLAMLDEVTALAGKPGRAEAIRYVPRDWATGMGMIRAKLDGPEGAN